MKVYSERIDFYLCGFFGARPAGGAIIYFPASTVSATKGLCMRLYGNKPHRLDEPACPPMVAIQTGSQ